MRPIAANSLPAPVWRVRFLRPIGNFDQRNDRMPLTQTQLVSQLAEDTELSKADIKNVISALEDLVLAQLGEAEKVKIGSLVQLEVKLKPATKAREGRNPATGETITIAAKPASVALKARPLAKAKSALPTVQKAKKKLG